MLPQVIIQTIEILKPVTSFISWALAIRSLLVKIYETIRGYIQQKAGVQKAHVIAEIYRKLGEIDGITRRYRYRQTKVVITSLRKDMEQINKISSELFEKMKKLTAKSLFDIIKDPPQEFPSLPSDEILKEFPILELVIKEEIKNIGNVIQRTLRLIKKDYPEIA